MAAREIGTSPALQLEQEVARLRQTIKANLAGNDTALDLTEQLIPALFEKNKELLFLQEQLRRERESSASKEGSLNDRVNDLTRTIATKASEIENLIAERDAATEDATTASRAADNAREALSIAETSIHRAEADVETQKNRSRRLDTDLSRVRGDLLTNKRTLETALTGKGLAEREREAAQRAIRELQEQVEDLTRERDELSNVAEREREAAQGATRELQGRVEDLTRERDELSNVAEREREAAQGATRELQGRVEDLTRERDELSNVNTALIAELATLQTLITGLGQTTTEFARQMQESKRREEVQFAAVRRVLDYCKSPQPDAAVGF